MPASDRWRMDACLDLRLGKTPDNSAALDFLRTQPVLWTHGGRAKYSYLVVVYYEDEKVWKLYRPASDIEVLQGHGDQVCTTYSVRWLKSVSSMDLVSILENGRWGPASFIDAEQDEWI